MYGGGLVNYKMWLCTQGKKVAKFELGPKDILASLLLDQQLFAQSCALDQFTKKTQNENTRLKNTDLCKWVGVHWPVWAAAFKRGPLCLISISL